LNMHNRPHRMTKLRLEKALHLSAQHSLSKSRPQKQRTCIVLGLLLCVALNVGCAADSTDRWHGFPVDKIGWVGIEEDEQATPFRVTEFVTFSGLHLVPAQQRNCCYLLYYPSKDALSRKRGSALMLARFSPAPGSPGLTTKKLDTDIFFGKTEEQGFSNGLPLKIVPGHDGPQVWYVHPYRRLLVCYDTRSAQRDEWDLSPLLDTYRASWVWDTHWLDFYPDPAQTVVHFAVFRRGGVVYVRYDLQTKQWTEQEVGIPASPRILMGERGLSILTNAYDMLLHFRRRAAAKDKTQPSRNMWESYAIAPMVRPGENPVLFKDSRGRLHVLYWDYSYSIFHIEGDGKLWRMERIKKLRQNGPSPRSRNPLVALSLSVTVSQKGTIHLACFDPVKEQVQHLWKTNGHWFEEKVASAQDVPLTAISLSGNTIIIAYVDALTREVWVAFKEGGDTLASRNGARALKSLPPVHYLPVGQRNVISLHSAAELGDTENIEKLLALGADVNGRERNGSTALHWAVWAGHTDASRLLLERGARADAQDDGGTTPLHLAAFKGDKEAIELLLAYGADINAKDKGGITPLHNAVMQGHRDATLLLLNRGADVNATDKRGCTALYLATEAGKSELMQLLLDAGAEMDIFTASSLGKVDRVAELLETEPGLARASGISGMTPLHYAAMNGDVQLTELLLGKGADTEARTEKGETALHLAAARGHTEVVLLLLKNGADINAKDNEGRTTLDIVLEKSHTGVFKALVGSARWE